LSGFTDADGCFFIQLRGKYNINKSKDKKNQVLCSFSLVQRKIDKLTNLSCVPFMLSIANHFQVNLFHDKKNDALRLIISARRNHNLVKLYFDKYPLMSSKYLNYLSYLEGINYTCKSLTEKEIAEIHTIKNSMNNARTNFN
jgi:hypothetical protein